jgi:hypothetical protein
MALSVSFAACKEPHFFLCKFSLSNPIYSVYAESRDLLSLDVGVT